MRTQSVQTIQWLRRSEPRRRFIAPGGRSAGAGEPEHTPYWRAQEHHCAGAGSTRTPHGSAPAVYKIKPLFRARAKGQRAARPSRRARGSFVRQGRRDRLQRQDQTRRRSKEPLRDRHPSLLLCKHYEARVTQARGPRELRGRRAAPPAGPAHPPPVNGIDSEQNDRPPACARATPRTLHTASYTDYLYFALLAIILHLIKFYKFCKLTQS